MPLGTETSKYGRRHPSETDCLCVGARDVGLRWGRRPELQGVHAQEPALDQPLGKEDLRVHITPLQRAGGTASAPHESQAAVRSMHMWILGGEKYTAHQT